jgi:glycosyltransferase involved in cell wall biosynthesis
MKFSIITVCLNSEQVLPRAMESLIHQTCNDLEWVVVDGASTDRTVDCVQSFHPAQLRLLSEPDDGIYDAMNKALRMASGDYVYFLNSDDRFRDPYVLSDVAEAIQQSGEPDLLIGHIIHTRGSTRILRTFTHINRRRILFDSLCHQAVVARRDLFDRFGHFDCRYELSADYDWLIRVLRFGARVKYINRVIADFNGDGIHSRRLQTTQAENQAVRNTHSKPLELTLGSLFFRSYNRVRRVLGFQSVGRYPIS